LAGGLCFWRATREAVERESWLAFGLAMMVWAAGFIAYPLLVAGIARAAAPSAAARSPGANGGARAVFRSALGPALRRKGTLTIAYQRY
jgi:hypothetical protein